MGAEHTRSSSRQAAAQEDLLVRFATLMWERYGARVYLFGSRTRGTARPDSDYDLVAVAPSFAQQPRLQRAPDRRELWLQAGGWRLGLDLHCYSPAEFRSQVAGGLGYLGQAKMRGELLEITPKARPKVVDRVEL